MEQQHLHRPLLSVINTASVVNSIATTTPNATSCIVQRLLLVIVIGVISIWANNEASKGFEIRVINEMKGTPVGDKFSLFYVYNDEATRLVQSVTTSVTNILLSGANNMPAKIIDQVDVRLTRNNLTHDYVIVSRCSEEKNRFLLSVSLLIMEFDDFRSRFRKEIHRGMAEVLLFDKRGKAPKTLIDGLVEYLSNQEGSNSLIPVFRPRSSSGKCWEDKNPKVVARFLRFCEGRSEGFIGRLYQEMSRDDWDDHVVDKALGISATPLCESLHNSIQTSEDIITI